MAAGGKFTKTKVYAGSGNSRERAIKQTRKAGVDQWEEKTTKEKRQYIMPQSAPALQPAKRTTPTVPQGPVTKAQDDQTRALVNGTVRAAPQGAITKSQADAAIEVLLAPTRKSAFPSAGVNTGRGVTDRFLKQPSGTERADAAIKRNCPRPLQARPKPLSRGNGGSGTSSTETGERPNTTRWKALTGTLRAQAS